MLPSRNRRGRNLKVASSLIGWPSESICIVTMAACTPFAPPLLDGLALAEAVVSLPPSTPPQAGLSLVHDSTLVTSPKFVYSVSRRFGFTAPTPITASYAAGNMIDRSPSLPTAATKTIPAVAKSANSRS